MYQEKFTLQHVVLYAKHWYERTDNVFNDLELCLNADGYDGTFIGDNEQQRKFRVASLILGQFQRITTMPYATTLTAFYEGIHPHNCWKFGYTTKIEHESYPEYDMIEATVRYCLSHLTHLDSNEWTPIAPNYIKVGLKKPKRIKYAKIKLMFG